MNETQLPKGRLLIVDDVADNRTMLKRFFDRRGYDVMEAAGGRTALELIEQSPFDAVLLDVMMPEMDGFEVLRRIRAVHSPAELPVIMVTARVESADTVTALELGANDYISKPIEFRVVAARVQSQLARLQAERALVAQLAELERINRRLEHEVFERQQSEAAIRHMAQHDSLTGIANRSRFQDQLNGAIAAIDAGDGTIALLFMDLDQFKMINDTLGHRVGDLLLIAVSERLSEIASPDMTFARLGGDEFAAILHTGAGRVEASAMAERLTQTIARPFEIENHQLIVSCSIGIAVAPTDGRDAETLLANADLALYRAKSETRGGYRFFEKSMNESARARRQLEGDLHHALAQRQFELHFQPLLDLRSGTIAGLEALVRWKHPERGLVAPLEFIPVAEETGLIIPLGRWILQEACREASHWPAGMRVAVNLSPRQFRSGTLVEDVAAALVRSGLEHGRLELEITESVLLDDDRKTMAALHDLRKLGVRICMDDFGTGYSSLSYLRTFPFDKIKIDRSFVQDFPADVGCTAIIRAVIGLAATLGMVTTVEGVETEQQLECLRQEGCNEVQGYLISRPISAPDTRELLGKTGTVFEWQSDIGTRRAHPSLAVRR